MVTQQIQLHDYLGPNYYKGNWERKIADLFLMELSLPKQALHMANTSFKRAQLRQASKQFSFTLPDLFPLYVLKWDYPNDTTYIMKLCCCTVKLCRSFRDACILETWARTRRTGTKSATLSRDGSCHRSWKEFITSLTYDTGVIHHRYYAPVTCSMLVGLQRVMRKEALIASKQSRAPVTQHQAWQH